MARATTTQTTFIAASSPARSRSLALLKRADELGKPRVYMRAQLILPAGRSLVNLEYTRARGYGVYLIDFNYRPKKVISPTRGNGQVLI